MIKYILDYVKVPRFLFYTCTEGAYKVGTIHGDYRITKVKETEMVPLSNGGYIPKYKIYGKKIKGKQNVFKTNVII